MAVIRAKYDLFGNHPGVIKMKATCPVHATWDNRDYGANAAGAEYR